MRPENEARLRKIRWVSRSLRVICAVILGLFLLVLGIFTVMLCVWGFPDDFGSGGIRVVVVGVLAVLMGLLFKSGYHLYRLLGNYSRGEIFTTGSAEQIRQWGIAWTLMGVMKFSIRFLPRVVLSHMNGPSEGLDGLDEVVSGLIIVAISWFMAVAAEMREEQDLIV
jgi:hypothetical protein